MATRSEPGALQLGIYGVAHGHVEYILAELARRPSVELVGIADEDKARRETFAARLGVPAYATLHDLLAAGPLDAVAVIAEFGSRGAAVAALAARGILAIVDKPMATRLDDLATIEKATGERALVALMLEKRFYPVTQALFGLVAQGTLGEIVTIAATGPHKLNAGRRPAWMFDPARYGGILADLAVHDIDLALALTGATRGQVRGWKSPMRAEGTADFALAGRATLTTDGGCEIVVDVDYRQPAASPRHGDYALRVVGTKGRADAFFALGKLIVETDERPAHEPVLPAGSPPAAFAFDHLVAGTPLAIPTKAAIRATRVALLAEESACAGGAFRAFF